MPYISFEDFYELQMKQQASLPVKLALFHEYCSRSADFSGSDAPLAKIVFIGHGVLEFAVVELSIEYQLIVLRPDANGYGVFLHFAAYDDFAEIGASLQALLSKLPTAG